MQKQFFLSKNGSHVGPFSFDDVLKKLHSEDHHWMDYVYDDTAQDWIMLMEHPQFTDKFNEGHARPSAKPIAPQPTKVTDLRPENRLREKEWFLLKEGNNYGPFSVLDLVQMLQEKTLYEFDYVWHHGMSAWKRVAEVAEFAPAKIRDMKYSPDADVSEIFFRRRHARAQYGCSLIVHNSKAVFKGRSLELSEGGAGIIIDNPNLQPGQTVYLHFQPGDGVPPFNAVCTVVAKAWVKDSPESVPPVKYGVKFTSISQAVRESIRSFIEPKQKIA